MSDLTKACRDTASLKPKAQKACHKFLSKCKELGIDIFVTETYRSQEKQNYLYEQGRTRKGNIVTWTKNSRHTSGLAWDIACRGDILYDKSVLKKAGDVAESLGIVWGGNWDSPDMPHFEISVDWQDIKEESMKEKRYMKIDDIPQWGKETIEKLVTGGKIADGNRLDLTEDMVRVLVIINR